LLISASDMEGSLIDFSLLEVNVIIFLVAVF
jgi:hypothetical protein